MNDLAARIERSARRSALAALQLAAMSLAGDARAQSNACEQLKATLSARIEASGVRDYSLDAVPADTPMPPGARIIGTCDAGQTKMLYRRGDGKQQPTTAPVAAPPALAAPPGAASKPKARMQAPPASGADVASVDRAPTPAPAPAPAPPPIAAPPAPVAQSVEAASAPSRASASEFAAANWKWLLALVLVLAAGVLWLWLAHRSAYDKSGLPRGPRLRV